MKANIIYRTFLNYDGKGVCVGGIQTYLRYLSLLLMKIGYEVHIHQKSYEDFTINYEGIIVNGYKMTSLEEKKPAKFLYKKCRDNSDQNDLLIFGDDIYIQKNDYKKSIAIQHGVFWDKPNRLGCSQTMFLLDYVMQAFRSWKIISRLKMVDQVVCVDHNFVNWYRALVAHPQVKLNVIPNFSQIPKNQIEKKDDVINIIFARRFFDYRGTRIFADAIEKILNEYKNIKITVAGDGPDKEYLHTKLEKFKNVSFITYKSDESLKVHADKHIAIIPTLGSEGTSLSLLEAMASRCAVICTNVGGMTNIVIDKYNGLMINPDEKELYRSIKMLLDNKSLMEQLSDRAYETVKTSFSLTKWENSWKEVLNNLSE